MIDLIAMCFMNDNVSKITLADHYTDTLLNQLVILYQCATF